MTQYNVKGSWKGHTLILRDSRPKSRRNDQLHPWMQCDAQKLQISAIQRQRQYIMTSRVDLDASVFPSHATRTGCLLARAS